MYEESAYTNYFLPDPMTFKYPIEPYDAFRWFNPALREWLSQIFQVIIAKIESADELDTTII